jgi:hypothetical protein
MPLQTEGGRNEIEKLAEECSLSFHWGQARKGLPSLESLDLEKLSTIGSKSRRISAEEGRPLRLTKGKGAETWEPGRHLSLRMAEKPSSPILSSSIWLLRVTSKVAPLRRGTTDRQYAGRAGIVKCVSCLFRHETGLTSRTIVYIEYVRGKAYVQLRRIRIYGFLRIWKGYNWRWSPQTASSEI